jgi:hypothetical protein
MRIDNHISVKTKVKFSHQQAWSGDRIEDAGEMSFSARTIFAIRRVIHISRAARPSK